MAPQPPRPLLRVEEIDGVTVVKFTTDDLGETNIQAVVEELFALAEGRAVPRLRLDLGEVRFLTSTALNSFVALHKRLQAHGGQLVLVNVTEAVYEIFDVSRLHQLLDVQPQGRPAAGPALPPSPPAVS
jgi:anti-anti-sigma factor